MGRVVHLTLDPYYSKGLQTQTWPDSGLGFRPYTHTRVGTKVLSPAKDPQIRALKQPRIKHSVGIQVLGHETHGLGPGLSLHYKWVYNATHNGVFFFSNSGNWGGRVPISMPTYVAERASPMCVSLLLTWTCY